MFRLAGHFELHLIESIHDIIAQCLLNVTHGNLALLLLTVINHTDAILMELDNGLHHAESLVQGTVEVMLRE